MSKGLEAFTMLLILGVFGLLMYLFAVTANMPQPLCK